MQQKKDIEHNFGSIKDEFIITNYQVDINLKDYNNNNIIDSPNLKKHIKTRRSR